MSGILGKLDKKTELGTLLQKQGKVIDALFGNDTEKSMKFRATALQIALDKNLKDCNTNSIINCIVGIAQLDLSIDKNMGQCYIIPYKTKTRYTVAQLQVGYRGYIQLLYRAWWQVQVYPVYNCDVFHNYFDNEKMMMAFDFKPNFDKRQDENPQWVFENLKGIFCVAKDGRGNILTEFVTKGKIENSRLKSDNQKGSLKPLHIWAEFYEDMAKKTGIRKISKYIAFGDKADLKIAEAIEEKSEINFIDIAKNSLENKDISEYIDVETGEILSTENTVETNEIKDPKEVKQASLVTLE